MAICFDMALYYQIIVAFNSGEIEKARMLQFKTLEIVKIMKYVSTLGMFK